MPGHDFTTGEVLTAANVDAYLNNSFYAQMRQTVAQNISDSTATALTFTTEDFDTDAGHDTGSNTSRYTCQTAGRYLLGGKFSFAGNTTGQRYGQWYKNGSGIAGSAVRLSGAANQHACAMTVMLVDLAVSDYVELVVQQNSGGTLATLVAAGNDMQSLFLVMRWSS